VAGQQMGLTDLLGRTTYGTESVHIQFMLRITRLSDYAIVILAEVARGPGGPFTARHAAASTKLPLPAVSKILKSLAKKHLIVSQRGVLGGYRLEREPSKIALSEIIDAVEGQVALTECGRKARSKKDACEYQDSCGLKANWARVNGVVRRALSSVTLLDMIGPGARELVSLRLGRERLEGHRGVVVGHLPSASLRLGVGDGRT
jgi:FeS assembly SUF system regulator